LVPILRFVPDAAAELRFELAENVHQVAVVASLAAGRGILPRPPRPIRGGGCLGSVGFGLGTAARTAADRLAWMPALRSRSAATAAQASGHDARESTRAGRDAPSARVTGPNTLGFGTKHFGVRDQALWGPGLTGLGSGTGRYLWVTGPATLGYGLTDFGVRYCPLWGSVAWALGSGGMGFGVRYRPLWGSALRVVLSVSLSSRAFRGDV